MARIPSIVGEFDRCWPTLDVGSTRWPSHPSFRGPKYQRIPGRASAARTARASMRSPSPREPAGATASSSPSGASISASIPEDETPRVLGAEPPDVLVERGPRSDFEKWQVVLFLFERAPDTTPPLSTPAPRTREDP